MRIEKLTLTTPDAAYIGYRRVLGNRKGTGIYTERCNNHVFTDIFFDEGHAQVCKNCSGLSNFAGNLDHCLKVESIEGREYARLNRVFRNIYGVLWSV